MSFAKICILAAAAVLSAGGVSAAPVLHTTDFIPNATRGQFNGFESAPPGVQGDTSTDTSYTEGGITATMIKGSVGTLATEFPGTEGAQFWYSNGGNHGYVRITQADGTEFTDVGLLAGDGFGGSAVAFVYDLRLHGAQVLFGLQVGVQGQYLGFSGGGFDEIRLIAAPAVPDFGADFRDIYPVLTEINPPVGSFAPENFNAIWVDSIETPGGGGAVPEPGSVALLGMGIAALGLMRRRRAA